MHHHNGVFLPMHLWEKYKQLTATATAERTQRKALCGFHECFSYLVVKEHFSFLFILSIGIQKKHFTPFYGVENCIKWKSWDSMNSEGSHSNQHWLQNSDCYVWDFQTCIQPPKVNVYSKYNTCKDVSKQAYLKYLSHFGQPFVNQLTPNSVTPTAGSTSNLII